MVYINDVRSVMNKVDGSKYEDYSIKKLSKKNNKGFKGYEILVYKPNLLQNTGIIHDLTELGLLFVSKQTNKSPYCERWLFNF